MIKTCFLGVLVCFVGLKAIAQKGEFYLKRGLECYQHQKFKDAIEWLTLSLEREPANKCKCFQLRGVARILLNESESAKMDIDSAFVICGNDADTYYAKGLVNYFSKEADSAIYSFTKAILLNPQKVNYYVNRAESYGLKNDSNGFKNDLYQAIRIDSSNFQPYFNLGVFFKNSGQFAKGAVMLKKSYLLFPKTETMISLVFCYLKLEKYSDVVSLSSAILEINDADGSQTEDLLIIRGQAYQALSNNASACQDFLKAASLNEEKAKEYVKKYCK